MKNKAPLPLMEQLIMVLVFALAAALCLQGFVVCIQLCSFCIDFHSFKYKGLVFGFFVADKLSERGNFFHN